MSGTADSQTNQLMSDIFGSSCDEDSDNDETSNSVHSKSRSSLMKCTHDESGSNCESGNILDKSELTQSEHFSRNELQAFVKPLPLVNADVRNSLCSPGAGSEKVDGGEIHNKKLSRPGDGHDSNTALLQQSEESVDLYSDILHLADGDNDIEDHCGGSLKDSATDHLGSDDFADPGRKVERSVYSRDASKLTDKDTSVDLYSDILNDGCCENGIMSGSINTAVPVNPKSSPGRHSVDNSCLSSTQPLVKSPLPSLDLYTEILCDDVVKRDLSNQEIRRRFFEAQDYISFLHEKLDTARTSNEKLIEENSVLKKNMSSLLLTAQTELRRKSSQIVSLRRQTHPAVVNALAKLRKNGYKDNPLPSSSSHLSSLISDESFEYSQTHGESSTPHVRDTDFKSSRLAGSCVEYGDKKTSRDADESEIPKRRKHEEDYTNDFEKQKVPPSVSARERTAKRILDKCPGSSDPSNRQREKHYSRTGDLRDKIVGISSRDDKHSFKEDKKAYENDKRRKGEKENGVRKEHTYERDKKTRSTSKTDHSTIRATDKYDRRERNSHSDKARQKHLDPRSHRSSPSSKVKSCSSQNRYASSDNSPSRIRSQIKKHTESSHERTHSHRQGDNHSTPNKKTDVISKSGMCSKSGKCHSSETVRTDSDECYIASEINIGSSDTKHKPATQHDETFSVKRVESDKERHKENEFCTEQKKKECGVSKVIDKWNTDKSEDCITKTDCGMSQSVNKLHVWQRSQSGKRLFLKSVQENVLDISQIKTKEFTSTSCLSLESTDAVACPKQMPEAVSVKDAGNVSCLEGRMKKQIVSKQVDSAVRPCMTAEDITKDECKMDVRTVVDEVVCCDVSSATHDSLENKSPVSAKSTVLKAGNHDGLERNGTHLSKGVYTENTDLGDGASHSTPISQKPAILKDDVEQEKGVSDSDMKTCTEPGHPGIETRGSPIHLTSELPNPVSMECIDHNIEQGNFVPVLRVVDMESGVANVEQSNCPDSSPQVSPNRISKEAGDLGRTSHAPLISHKPVVLGHSPSPNNICRDGDNKSSLSRVLAKSIGFQDVEHVKQVDDVHHQSITSEKTLNVKGNETAVEQRNRASNLPLVSLKRKRVADGDQTTTQSDRAVHSVKEVILEGGDHIDEVSHLLVSPKETCMQYTTVASTTSHNSKNTTTKEVSSVAKTDETNDSTGKIPTNSSTQKNGSRKSTKKLKKINGSANVLNNVPDVPNLKIKPKEIQDSNGIKETSEMVECKSSNLKDGESSGELSNLAKSSKHSDSAAVMQREVLVSDDQVTCNPKSAILFESCPAECLIQHESSSKNAAQKVKLPKNKVLEQCQPSGNISPKIAAKEVDIVQSTEKKETPGVEVVSSSLETLGTSDTKQDHQPLSIIVSIPKLNIIIPVLDCGSNNHGKDARCLEIDNPGSNKNEAAVAKNVESNILKLDSEHVKQKHTASSAVLSSGNNAESKGDPLDKEQPYVLHKIDNIPQEIKSWKSRLDKFKKSNFSLCETMEYPVFSNVSANKSVSFSTFRYTSVNTSTPNSKPHALGVNEKLSESNHLTFNESAILSHSRSFSPECDIGSEAAGLAVPVGETCVTQHVEIQNHSDVFKLDHSQPTSNQSGDVVCDPNQTTIPDISAISATKVIKTERYLPDCEASYGSSDAYCLDSNCGSCVGCVKLRDKQFPFKGNSSVANVTDNIDRDMDNDCVVENRKVDIDADKGLPLRDTLKKPLFPARYSDCDDGRSSISDDLHIIQVYLDDSYSSDSVLTQDSSVTLSEMVETSFENGTCKLVDRDPLTEDNASDKSSIVTDNDECCNSFTVANTRCDKSGDVSVEDTGCKSSFNTMHEQLDVTANDSERPGSFTCGDTVVLPDEKVITECLGESPDESVKKFEGCARSRLYRKCLKSNDTFNSQTSVNNLETGIAEDLNTHSGSKMCISARQSVCEKRRSLDTGSSLLPATKNNMLNTADVQTHCDKNSVNVKENKDSHSVVQGYAYQHDEENREAAQQTLNSQNLIDHKTNTETKEMVSTNSGESKDMVSTNSGESKDMVSTNSGESKDMVSTNIGESKNMVSTNVCESKEMVSTNSGESNDMVSTNSGESKDMVSTNSGESKDMVSTNSDQSKDMVSTNIGESKDMVSTNICESSKDSDSSDSSDEENSSSDEESSSSDNTSSDSDSDVDETKSVYSASSEISNSQQTVNGTDDSNVSKLFERLKPINELFSSMPSNENGNTDTSKPCVSKVSKTSVRNTQTSKAKDSKAKDTTAKIISDKSDTMNDKDNPIYNENTIEYPCISVDADECSVQLHLNSDETISDDSSLEDGELGSESPRDYNVSKRLTERKPNYEPLIKLKTSHISTSTTGQKRGQRKGTKLSVDLHRPMAGESHSSNQTSKELPTLNRYKIPRKSSSGSQKRPFSHANSIDRSPKRKRLEKSPMFRKRVDLKDIAKMYSGRSARIAFSPRKHSSFSPVKSRERRVSRVTSPQRTVKHTSPIHGRSVKRASERGCNGHTSGNKKPKGPRTPPEVPRRKDEGCSSRYLSEMSERCRRHSGDDKGRTNQLRSPSPLRGSVKDDYANKQNGKDARMRSSQHTYRRRSTDSSPHRYHGPRTPPRSFNKNEYFDNEMHRNHQKEKRSYSTDRYGSKHSGDGACESLPGRRPKHEMCSSDSDSAKIRRTKSHSPTACTSKSSSYGHSRLWKGPRTPPSPVQERITRH
ncbi:uncharacterized protein LOC121369625 [Gigantopelta aegis]|uniref:uncharacterized protein LOC121369625 n=1 Tax=Gigantopelta aegis TaxID=1735272 RepID=UPI001B88A7DB|nr:uncharacterized protein LOC121369625 [Gigantopelta aegis]